MVYSLCGAISLGAWVLWLGLVAALLGVVDVMACLLGVVDMAA